MCPIFSWRLQYFFPCARITVVAIQNRHLGFPGTPMDGPTLTENVASYICWSCQSRAGWNPVRFVPSYAPSDRNHTIPNSGIRLLLFHLYVNLELADVWIQSSRCLLCPHGCFCHWPFEAKKKSSLAASLPSTTWTVYPHKTQDPARWTPYACIHACQICR